MIRIKNFDATGIAPNGRLYAGDLNLLQDTAAALVDYLQNLGTGTLAIGDSSLVLSKFGVGEIQISAALRTLGIIRGAGGLISGSYTTTARNAIPAGSRPYGLIILNTTTNQYEWNVGSDAVPNWISVAGIDFLEGTFGAMPAASAVRVGTLYHATDVAAVYRSNGAAWILVAIHPDGSGNLSVSGNFRAESGGFRLQRHPYGNERHIESGLIPFSSGGDVFPGGSFTNAFNGAPKLTFSVWLPSGVPNAGMTMIINDITATSFGISLFNIGVISGYVTWIAEGQD